MMSLYATSVFLRYPIIFVLYKLHNDKLSSLPIALDRFLFLFSFYPDVRPLHSTAEFALILYSPCHHCELQHHFLHRILV